MYLKASDTVSGRLGRVYATIDGRNEEMLYVKNITATAIKHKTQVPVIGSASVQYRAGGWSGSGTMSIYYATSVFRRLMIDYIKTGKDTYFDLVVENDDPSSSAGGQTVMLKGVNLDSIALARIDIDAEVLDEKIEFTFDDAELLEAFK